MKPRLALSLAVLSLCLSALLSAQEKSAPAVALSPIEFLVGDWHATATPPNGKPTEIDNHIYWSENKAAIYFVTRFNGIPHYSGMYAYDPAEKKIAFWYLDTEGNSTRGTAVMEGNRLRQAFTNSRADGVQERLVSYIDLDASGNRYHWQVQREGATAPLIQLDYTRK